MLKEILAAIFIDDMSYLTKEKTFEEAIEKLKHLLLDEGSILEWAKEHNIIFEFDKCMLVGFSRNKDKGTCPKICMESITIKVMDPYKYLGITSDKELRFKEQFTNALAKGMAWITAIRRLCNSQTGLPPHLIPKLYKSIAILRILYGAKIFLPQYFSPYNFSLKRYEKFLTGQYYQIVGFIFLVDLKY